ncbi:hypothetical protein P775_23830 [Puniceibacterium antarcticum]|uniref:Uncharacterized protein n=1 Tax=Puniceibacterium antarcticum TaxID=1206336 RepID=A0A2G8R7W4_9RHOB|nr:hypothetical protein [Puniceibacterium antarcticum]PIL17612.1 hypothetical protein P775_23830 [Puniceibacterium antarcticum]
MCFLQTRAALILAAPLPALADGEAPVGKGIRPELNRTETCHGTCRMSFLAQNLYELPITGVVYETARFTQAGTLDRLTRFDFGALPPGRPRVRQFDLQDTECDPSGQILINGASNCTVNSQPDTDCDTCLTLLSRTRTELLA